MTTKVKDFEEVTYSYVSVVEMMAHVSTMGTSGYTLVAVNSVSLTAVYRKDLP